jgi:hypothetical protein
LNYNLSRITYPKQYADIRLGKYRIPTMSIREQENFEKRLYNIILEKALSQSGITNYKSKEYIGSGWEFSVFKDGDSVYKIPSQKFSEVSSYIYFQNILRIYSLLKFYFKDQVLDTFFSFEHDNFLIKQKFIPSIKDSIVIDLHDIDKYSSQQYEFKRFLENNKKILEIYEWMPDIRLQLSGNILTINNVAMVKGKLYLYDFSSYYDLFRLYPERTRLEVRNNLDLIKKINYLLN